MCASSSSPMPGRVRRLWLDRDRLAAWQTEQAGEPTGVDIHHERGLRAGVVELLRDAKDAGAIRGFRDIEVVAYEVGADAIIVAVRERELPSSLRLPLRQVATWSFAASEVARREDDFDAGCDTLDALLARASDLLPSLIHAPGPYLIRVTVAPGCERVTAHAARSWAAETADQMLDRVWSMIETSYATDPAYGSVSIEDHEAFDALAHRRGGRVGPIPDGTVFEVRPTDATELVDAIVPAGGDDGEFHDASIATIVAAFNASASAGVEDADPVQPIDLLYKLPVYVTVDLAQQKVLAVHGYESEIEPFHEGEVTVLTDETSDADRAAAVALADDAAWPHLHLTLDAGPTQRSRQ
jgi:hypothetical protein